MSKSVWFWFAVLAVFNVIDWTATAAEVSRWGVDSEANPAMFAVIAHSGMVGVALVKVLSVSALGVLILLVSGRQLGFPLPRVVKVLAVGFGVLAAYHGLILYSTNVLAL